MFKFLTATKNAVNFGENLARTLSTQYPASLQAEGKAKISVERVSRILESLYHKAQEYRDSHNIGYYSKTRLCHSFKCHLLESGYTKEFTDMATEGLIVYLSKPIVQQHKKPN